MAAKLEFFPVHNGDMTLLTLESGRTILIDINIRKDADDENNDESVDVATLLRDRLERDADGRLYVDAFLLTHPDADHCRGLDRHFHLGKAKDWKKDDDKIFIREMWSSPIIFRRKKDVDGSLCADAEAWWAEARRRVKLYKEAKDKSSVKDGDRIQILGEDKRDNEAISDIVVKIDTEITKICGAVDDAFRAWLLAPHLVSDEEAKELTGKNHSSTVIRFSIKGGDKDDAGRFLTGGDAEVENWERVWSRNKKRKGRLSYDILLAPHHCSWGALSHDSWSGKGEDAEVSSDARDALSQARDNAFIIASCKEIKDDKDDPPCIRAKREYVDILESVSGDFLCTTEECGEEVLSIEIGADGPKRDTGSRSVKKAEPKMTDKKGGGRYA